MNIMTNLYDLLITFNILKFKKIIRITIKHKITFKKLQKSYL